MICTDLGQLSSYRQLRSPSWIQFSLSNATLTIDPTSLNHSPEIDNAVFLPLQPPFKALVASTIASILEDAIKTAGLGTCGFIAKSFHPTGATMAIENSQLTDIVMKVGLWKTTSVFYGHYVHSNTPDTFTGAILLE